MRVGVIRELAIEGKADGRNILIQYEGPGRVQVTQRFEQEQNHLIAGDWVRVACWGGQTTCDTEGWCRFGHKG